MHVRVRGIYATAITKILLDEGIQVSHTSKKIRERFSLPEAREPPTVTVKDADERHGVVIVGDPRDGEAVYNVLRRRLPGCICWKSRLPLHAVIKGVVAESKDGRSIVDLGCGLRGVLDGEEEPGSEVVVDIARPVFPHEDTAKLSRNYTVYGRYVALIHGMKGRVIISRHITDPDLKQSLRMIAALSRIEGDWGVKWRSAASLGGVDELMRDLQETAKRAEEVLKAAEKASAGDVVYGGEFFAIIGFGPRAKERLDDIRNDVLPTLRRHHTIKSTDDEMTDMVDYTEYLLARGVGSRDALSDSLMGYIASALKEQKSVAIEHISVLTGEVKQLTPGQPVSVEEEGGEIACVLRRSFRGGGILDGLGVPKEAGDYDLMEVSTRLPILLHKYYSRDGRFKGLYVNVNTPPEISKRAVRYFDMEVDVVAKPDGEVRVIDEEKLKRALELGIVGEEECREYLLIAGRVKEVLEEYARSSDLSKITLSDLAEAVKA